MATGYSIFSTELTINGTAIAKPVEQEIVIPPKGEDENGVDRFSSNTKVENIIGTEILKVTSEECIGNSITTTMKVQSTLSFFGSTLNITLDIQNGSKNTFTNGKIELIEYSDSGNSLTSRTQTLSEVTVEPGSSTTATISGTVYVRRIQTGTYYKYKISFDANNETKEFYYTLKLEP